MPEDDGNTQIADQPTTREVNHEQIGSEHDNKLTHVPTEEVIKMEDAPMDKHPAAGDADDSAHGDVKTAAVAADVKEELAEGAAEGGGPTAGDADAAQAATNGTVDAVNGGKNAVSDEELAKRIRELLPQVNLEETTERKLRQRLEAELDADLSGQKAVIKKEIADFLAANEEDGGGDGDDEDEAPPTKKAKKNSGAAAAAPKRKGGGGFTKQCKISDDLAAWVGQETISRPELTKFFWAYIKEKNLKDPSNGSMVLADDDLYKLTGQKKFKAFGFMKHFGKHILPD